MKCATETVNWKEVTIPFLYNAVLLHDAVFLPSEKVFEAGSSLLVYPLPNDMVGVWSTSGICASMTRDEAKQLVKVDNNTRQVTKGCDVIAANIRNRVNSLENNLGRRLVKAFNKSHKVYLSQRFPGLSIDRGGQNRFDTFQTVFVPSIYTVGNDDTCDISKVDIETAAGWDSGYWGAVVTSAKVVDNGTEYLCKCHKD